jgi:DNA modification methylase
MEEKQQKLYEGEDLSNDFYTLIDKDFTDIDPLDVINKIDWDFKGFNTQYLTHKFHSYPARFIPQIPLSFIKIFTKEGDTVLDPMCGGGTTLVEAFLNNRNSIGVDINPLSVLISKVKTTLLNEEEMKYLDYKLKKMKRYIDLDFNRSSENALELPNRKISKVFNKIVLSKLESIRDYIEDIKEEGYIDSYDLTRVAFSQTIWSFVENGVGEDVDEQFFRTVNMYLNQLRIMQNRIKKIPQVKVIKGDSRLLPIENAKIDLIVTSPPYVNALDYYRTHMYNMLWLGMDFSELKRYEIGGHSHFINNRFRLLSEYLGDMLRSMIEMNRVLKIGKYCVIVVGNSSLEYELIESHKFFEDFSKDIGFKPVKTIFRNIDTTRKYLNNNVGQINDEFIIVLKKENNSPTSSSDDNFILEAVKREMLIFREFVKTHPGSSIRGKHPTLERLRKNLDKLDEAISLIEQDIRMVK